MNDSGVPEGLGMIGHPQVGQAGVGVSVWPGNDADVQGIVTAVFGVAAVSVDWGGKNQGP